MSCDTFRQDTRPTGAYRPPVAHSDAYATTVNKAIVVVPLANDTVYSQSKLIMEAPAVGQLTAIAKADTFMYTPRQNFVGLDSISYTIMSGSEVAKAKVMIQVTRGNDSCQVVTVNDDFDVLSGTITSVFPVRNDLNCDPVSLFSFTQPAVGSASNPGRNEIAYLPRPGFAGADSMTYTIRSNTGGLATGKIRFHVLANPSCDTAFRPQPDTVYFTSGSFNSVRVLISTLVANDRHCLGDINANSFTKLNDPQYGTVTVDALGVTYTPNGNALRQSFRYNVTNANGTINASATVYLIPKP